MAALMRSYRAVERARCLARNVSISAAREGLVKPPIHVFGIEGRYAHAIYSAASKEKQLEKVEAELSQVDQLIKDTSKLSEFILNPTLNKQKKQSLLTEILKAHKCSDLTVNLFGSLAENNRLKLIPNVVHAFGKLMCATRGEVLCTVTAAKELDSSQVKELQAALEAFLSKGETLKLETKVDPALIGGMVVDVGDKHIDMSMATKIKKITNVLREDL